MTSFAKYDGIAAQLSLGVRREVLSPGKIRLVLPWGFPYEAYGVNVVVKPWHILNLVESGRALSFNRLPNFPGDPFLNIHDLYKDFAIFQGSARLTVAKEMYDILIPKTPLTLEQELVYVGKSSLNLHTDVVLPARGLTLASCEVQSVLVDRHTHRPAPYPEWWRERFGGFTSPERQLKVEVCNAPEETKGTAEGRSCKHCSEGAVEERHRGSQPIKSQDQSQDLPIADCVTSLHLRIASSETDPYGHANWTSFLKYCVDAMMLGNSPDARNVLLSQGLKSADISFVREGSQGQTITVKFWKDTKVPRAMHFNIVDSQSGELVTYAFLQFYSLQEVRLPLGKL